MAERLKAKRCPLCGGAPKWKYYSLPRQTCPGVWEETEFGLEPGKMCDGEMSIRCYIDVDGKTTWTVWLYCYLIGPGRMYEWTGDTPADALESAEFDIEQWIEAEVKRDKE